MKRIYAMLILITLISGVYVYAEETKGEIADAVLRLHVVANSDSEADQALKIKENRGRIAEAAIAVINEDGFDSPVKVEIGKADFPTKSYSGITLPKGRYDAVNVKIGKAKGKNWWCVMYPPLCIADSVSAEFMPEAKAKLKAAVSDSQYKIISEPESGEIKIKFKILEIF